MQQPSRTGVKDLTRLDENCAKDLNLTILPKGTNNNLSWRIRCIEFSGILKYKSNLDRKTRPRTD